MRLSSIHLCGVLPRSCEEVTSVSEVDTWFCQYQRRRDEILLSESSRRLTLSTGIGSGSDSSKCK